MRAGLPAGTATMDAGLSAQSNTLTAGDEAILRFLSAAEIIETDLWIQYNELGGAQDSEVPGNTGGSDKYIKALQVLDGDMPQYIHDNTEDEISHFTFINTHLASKSATRSISISFELYRAAKPPERANRTPHESDAAHSGHQLVDTVPQPCEQSRPRSRIRVSPGSPNFECGTASGNSKIRRRPDPERPYPSHRQHSGISLRFHRTGRHQPISIAQRVTSVEVLRILLSIGPTETAHFQTWHDKAGNAPPLTDPKDRSLGLVSK
jgi:hypothetical protein